MCGDGEEGGGGTYFQKCCEKITEWTMLVDEIYYEVNADLNTRMKYWARTWINFTCKN
jgi:hypothetical protein